MIAASPDKLIAAYSQVGAANKRSLDKLTVVLARFRVREIDCILLKGADVLPRLYGAWGLRPMADVDLLVREPDLPAIDRILRELGYLPQIDGNPAYHDPDNTLALDLATEIWYTDDTAGIWRRAVRRTLKGLAVKSMSAEDLLLYLTAYAVLYRGSLSPVFVNDIALLAGREPLDWDFILDEACRRHLKVPLYHGLSYAVRRKPIAIPDQVFAKLAPSSLAEKWLGFLLRKLVTDRVVDGMGHFLLFITRPGGKKWRWLTASVYPSTAFLQYRYGDGGTRHPAWTRLKRVCHLAARAQILAVRIACLLVKHAHPSIPP